jgi:hypothetical protein
MESTLAVKQDTYLTEKRMNNQVFWSGFNIPPLRDDII